MTGVKKSKIKCTEPTEWPLHKRMFVNNKKLYIADPLRPRCEKNHNVIRGFILNSPGQVCLAKPFPGRVATRGKGRVSRNNKLDCSVLAARRNDISHLAKVFVKVFVKIFVKIFVKVFATVFVKVSLAQVEKHLLIAARLEGAALPLDHLGLDHF